jgi:hypothetical protein
MSNRSEQRLRRLEQANPNPPYKEVHFPYCSELELVRMRDISRAALKGDTASERELTRFMKAADERRTSPIHGFATVLGRRHGCCFDPNRFDALDLSEVEIKALTEVAEKATCVGDLQPVVELVGRLRLNARVVGMAAFEALVLRGEIAEWALPSSREVRTPTLTRKSPRLDRINGVPGARSASTTLELPQTTRRSICRLHR